MIEQTLFDRPKEILVTDPHTRDEDDERLAGQNLIIYNYIRDNPGATNAELINLSRATNFTARISNIRAYLEPQGRTVKCKFGKRGVNNYSIVKA